MLLSSCMSRVVRAVLLEAWRDVSGRRRHRLQSADEQCVNVHADRGGAHGQGAEADANYRFARARRQSQLLLSHLRRIGVARLLGHLPRAQRWLRIY
jgi:hypothetical protein